MQKRIICAIATERSESNFLLHIYESANMLDLTGEVSTREDGSVKIIAEGEEENLNNFVNKIKKGHSLFSLFTMVDNFYVKWEAATGEYKDFYIKDTKN